MATTAARITRAQAAAYRRPAVVRWLLLAAPAAALLDAAAAEWLDFRVLRAPLVLIVGLGVVATAYALGGARRGAAPLFTGLLTGVATWTLALVLYSAIHASRGEPFSFGALAGEPQWLQALALTGAHALFLGIPTGAAAGVALLGAAAAWRARHGQRGSR